MAFHFTLLGNSVGLSLPQSLVAWGLLFLYLILIYWRLATWMREPHQNQNPQPAIFAFLFILVPVTSLFMGISGSVPGTTDQTLLYSGGDTQYFILILAAIPWIVAGGLLNPIHSVLLGFVSGSIICVFTNHSLFTPFEYALTALAYSELLRSKYRGEIYKLARNPIGASVITGAFLILLSVVDGILGGANNYAQLLASNTLWTVSAFLILFLMVLIGGFCGQVASRVLPLVWVKPGFLLPTPNEKQLTRRFLTNFGPFIIFLLVLLLVGIWMTSSYSARLLVREQMAGAAEVASESIPFFTNSGQNLVLQFSRSIPDSANSAKDIQIALSQSLRSVQFFKQLLYVNLENEVIATAPDEEFTLTNAEREGIKQSAQGLLYGKYATFPTDEQDSVLISFIAPVKDGAGKNRGYLIGRTDLTSNPSTQAIISLLTTFTQQGGEGYIIDQEGVVIFHPQAKYIKSVYPGELAAEERYFSLKSSDGSPLLLYYKPTPDHDWAVVLSLPAGEIQNQTWRLALPLVIMVLVVSGLVYLVIRSGLNSITHALRQLTQEAEKIQKGELDHPQYVRGEDEVGQLGQAFEEMRIHLKDKMDEMGILLKVSQGIASNLDIDGAVQPILEAAMTNGGSMARIVLAPDSSHDSLNQSIERYGAGDTQKYYGYLDEQLLALTKSRDAITVNNVMRGRALKLNPEVLNPSAIISVPLKTEGRFAGILWIAYDQPRIFSESEDQFIKSLAGDVSLALENIRLYRSAELGRQRLHAILNSTPDPVLVIDNDLRILLANPPAVQLFNEKELLIEGKSVEEVIPHASLIALIRSGNTNVEIHLPGQKVYYAYQTAMSMDHLPVGKVIILRDISYFKEVDALKSEFVATVSHDLRAPLTLLRGYSTMLNMVGELNDQQKNYVKKIIGSVEGMTNLVNNLLDIGRIEAGMALQITKVPANRLVEKVVNSLQMQAGQKNIKLTTKLIEGDDTAVYADPPLVEQALYNLVENSIKYTAVNGQVTIAVHETEEKVIFEIKDSGIGIAPLDLPRLFDKFFRSSQRDGFQQKSSSLGLAIVKAIAERHHGRVWAESQLGKGSTFYFELPAVERDEKPIVEDSTESEESV